MHRGYQKYSRHTAIWQSQSHQEEKFGSEPLLRWRLEQSRPGVRRAARETREENHTTRSEQRAAAPQAQQDEHRPAKHATRAHTLGSSVQSNPTRTTRSIRPLLVLPLFYISSPAGARGSSADRSPGCSPCHATRAGTAEPERLPTLSADSPVHGWTNRLRQRALVCQGQGVSSGGQSAPIRP